MTILAALFGDFQPDDTKKRGEGAWVSFASPLKGRELKGLALGKCLYPTIMHKSCQLEEWSRTYATLKSGENAGLRPIKV